MNLTKKLSSIVLALILILGAFTVSAQSLSSYESSAIKTVSSLSLMPYAEEINADTTVTRSQMVESVLRLMGIDTQNYSETKEYIFSDVDYSKPYSKAVMAAYSLGLINGISNTEFAPDAPATIAQAVKVVVCALGYEIKAVSSGDYAAGYLTVAAQTGLLRGVSEKNENTLSAFTFAKILYNALDTPMFRQTMYGGTEKYEESDETPLTKYLNYNKVKGVITETNKVNLFGFAPSAPDGSVYVGSTLLKVNSTDIEDYLGYTANVYYTKNENTDEENIGFFMTEQYNKTLTLTSDDILSIAHSGNTLNLTYIGENGKDMKLSVSSAAYLYNGFAVSQSDVQSKVLPLICERENYTLTLIDNNLDGSYEVVKIENYTPYVVKRVNTYSQVIYCYDFEDMAAFKSVYLNAADENEAPFTIFGSNREEIELSEISPDASIAVYENLEGTYRDIYVSYDTVSGTVSEVGNDGKCVIDGKEYKIDKNVSDNLLGVNATFFLDINGKIIGKKSTNAATGGYGFLMDVFVPTSGGLTNYPQLKILTAEGDMKEFEAESKVTAYNPHTGAVEKTDFKNLINTSKTPKGYGDTKYMLWHEENSANFTFDTKSTDYTKEFYWRPWLSDEEKSDIASRKPVYYELNKDGRIIKILVPDIPNGENKISLLNNNGRYTFTYNSSSSTALDVSASSTGQVPHYRLSKTATVVSVMALDYSETDYTVASQGLSIIPNGAQRKMKLYSISGGKEADFIVSYAHLPYENIANMQYVVVDSVSRTSDDTLKLYGFSQGAKYEGIIKPYTRLVEKIPNSSNTEYNENTKITAKNILDFRSYSYGGTGRTPYNIATSTSSALYDNPELKIGDKTPYADGTSLKRGDIIIVGKNRGEEICYVEMAMRADNCVMLITQSQDDWYGRLYGSGSYFKGVVTALSGYDEVYMRIVGEYTGTIQRETTEGPDFRQSAYFDDKNAPYDFTGCKYVWIYDYARNRIEVVDAYAIEVGDVIVGRGSALSPKDCIILKNYPVEPDFSYWENE